MSEGEEMTRAERSAQRLQEKKKKKKIKTKDLKKKNTTSVGDSQRVLTTLLHKH